MPDIRQGEGPRLLLMLALLFFLLAANTIIKIVRDSIFLSQHTAAELPYVYLYSGFLAGVCIAVYGRYTSGISLNRLMTGSLAFITVSVLAFWYLLTYYNAGWVHYSFYVWGSIVFMVAVAQMWTFAEELFTPREGKRLFGILTTGGTLGGILGAFGVRWIINLGVGTIQLLWLVVASLVCAFAVCTIASWQRREVLTEGNERPAPSEVPVQGEGIIRLLRESTYLRAIGTLIFVSVIVSTLLDFQFKVAAKEAYATADVLAQFFASYYGWVSTLTLFAGFALTGQLVALIGLYPSLFILPAGLFTGSLGFLFLPGLALATVMRMSDAGLRPTFYRSLIEMLYFPIPSRIKTSAKTFLDVVAERLGDGSAGFIILFFSLTGKPNYTALVYCCIALTLVWLGLLPALRRGYLQALLNALSTRQLDFIDDEINYADNATVEAVGKILGSTDESALLLGLEFAERLDPRAIFARLPRSLLRHPSPTVQSRVLKLFSNCPDRTAVDEYLSNIAGMEIIGPVIQRALAARKNGIYPEKINQAILQLHSEATKKQARDQLVEYGEDAVEPLRAALFDSRTAREVRLNIPRTLSKIDAQAAMDTLLAGLEHEDGGVRYNVFLALEEMARRFPNLRLDHAAIENAIVADTMRYFRRFASFYVLFNEWQEPPSKGGWLLRQALIDSMERVKDRAIYLLSLIYPRAEIKRAFVALQSSDQVKKAYAVELLDNLLRGKVKQYLFSLFEDIPANRKYQKLLGLLGWERFDHAAAIEWLLGQEDAVITAATVWEIGVRHLAGFEEKITALASSENLIVKETAELVRSGVSFG
ncbi:MAG TPA: Npt1/Npt2 family nucleotide transporter [Methylomirabilota bacterium]|nr:Npt1/Npt2 family nucleotide transporter [Methylomirabilota bacterium]